MSNTTDGTHRAPATRQRAAPAETIHLRQPDDEDGVFEVQMPIATTGEVRNEGDDPLTRAELVGMAEQINDRMVPVFPDHGNSGVAREPYSAMEKLGEWTDARVREHGEGTDEYELVATARLMDPETLPAAARSVREMLAAIKEQVKRDMSLSSSIGWREDADYPGGVDLMEASIVGIGADPRTTADAEVGVVTRAAIVAGADPDDLLEQVRQAVAADGLRETGDGDAPDVDGERPLGPPGDRDRFDTFDECVATLSEDDDMSEADAEQVCGAWEQASKEDRATYEVGDTTVDITPPEPMANAAQAGLDAKQRFDGLDECGTGVGEDRARQIINDEVGPDVIEEVAAYLTSHEEDVAGIDEPPTDWGEETWTDGCGPVQYALWGGVATGTALDWAQRKANEVAEARDEELPYDRDGGPDRSAAAKDHARELLADRNIDDPEFSEGDAVMWSWDDTPVHGRVAGIHEQFTVDDGPTITGDEGEAVYSIHEYDEEVEAFRRENVAKPQSSLRESQMELPPATEENFQSMSTDDTADDSGGTTDEQTAGDGETTTRAPEDIDEADVAEFVSETYEGVSAGDIQDVMADAGAEFAGLSMDTLGWFIGDVVDIPAGEAEDLLASAMDGDGAEPDEEEAGDGEMDDDEEMDEEDEEDRDADAGDDDERGLPEDLADELREYDEGREALAEADDLREVIQVPGADEDETDTDAEQSADDDGAADPDTGTGLGDYSDL